MSYAPNSFEILNRPPQHGIVTAVSSTAYQARSCFTRTPSNANLGNNDSFYLERTHIRNPPGNPSLSKQASPVPVYVKCLEAKCSNIVEVAPVKNHGLVYIKARCDSCQQRQYGGQHGESSPEKVAATDEMDEDNIVCLSENKFVAESEMNFRVVDDDDLDMLIHEEILEVEDVAEWLIVEGQGSSGRSF